MKFNGENLYMVLEKHKRWLNHQTGGERADFSEACLRGANLIGADLRDVFFRDADLTDANLSCTDLKRAYFGGANLQGADLTDADLKGAIFAGAKNVPYIPTACPDSGSFIGWKKAWRSDIVSTCIIKLLIPEDAKRCSAVGRKCRCDKAVVLEIQDKQTGETLDADVDAYSDYDNRFIYTVGETVTPTEPFNEDRWSECTSGIHFFINRQEAVNY